MYFPLNDDTANVGSILAENASMAVSDTPFSQVELDSYMYTSGIVKVPIQLLQDNIVGLESYLNRVIPKRIGRAVNTHTTVGTGSSQPNGVVTASTLGATAAGASAIVRDDLLDLQHGVDIDYRFNGRYMFHDSTLLALKKLAVGSADDRPLWVPSTRDGAPSTIEGYAYTVNNDMPAIGTGNKSVLFGDFSEYHIRQVRGMAVVRFDEKYMDALQIGFAFYQRFDGELLDTNAVKHLIHP